MAADRRILIVGAGPVGLSAAIRLAEAGIPTLVLEAARAPAEDLRASTWHPPTLDMLAPYGLSADLIGRGLISPTWQVRLHETGERAVFDLTVLKDVTAHPYRVQCEQRVFVRLALDWLARHGETAEVRFGCEVTAAEQTDDQVSVRLATSGERLSGQWLIGADGARSVVRHAMGQKLAGSTYPETTILATTPFPFHDHLAGLSNVNYCWTEGGTFSLLRLPDEWRVSLYPWAGETLEAALAAPRIEAKLQAIVPRAGSYQVREVRPYRIHQRLARDYRRGRMVLAGDAAHLNSPSGGMGMNGGIHDAFNLTGKLIRLWRGEAGADILDLYTRQRRPIAESAILAQADRNRRRMQERDSVRRRAILADLQATAADPARARAYLLRSSMIDGLRRAAEIE